MSIFLIIFFGLFQMQATPQPEKIYGSVYITDDPLDADIRVYNEPSQGLSDLRVFWVDSDVFADKPGLWYRTEVKSLADYVIYFETEHPEHADFRVHFVESIIFAGVD